MTYVTYFFCFALIHLTFGQLTNPGQGTLNTQRLSNLLPNSRTLSNLPSQPYRTLGNSPSNALARNLATSGYGPLPDSLLGIARNGQPIAGNIQGLVGNGRGVAVNALGNFANTNTISGISPSRSTTSPYIANTPSILTNPSLTGTDNTDQLRANLAYAGIANQVPSNIGNVNFRNARVIKYELGISQDDGGNINGRLANSGRQYGLKVDTDGLKMVGDVTVNGKLPIYGTVGLNGKLPTKGAGNVEFSC